MTKPWWTRALLGRTAVSNPLKDDEGPDPQFDALWRPLVKKRLFAIFACLAVWAVSLEGRLIWIQVAEHSKWTAIADKQHLDNEIIEGTRGEIRDRHGRLLAYSVPSYDVYVNADLLKKTKTTKFTGEPASFAKLLCAAFTDCEPGEEAAIAAKLEKPKDAVLIRRGKQMPFDAIQGVRALNEDLKEKKKVRGIFDLRPVQVRYAPNLTLAAQVIGTVDENGVGLTGVEKQFDRLLRGTPGQQVVQVDGKENDRVTTMISAPKPGVSIYLTIDLTLQEILERELTNAVQTAGASGGTAVMLDSRTGEVLAMSSLPALNLNVPSKVGHLNRAVQDLYEPGSTYKVVTLSAALNEGVVNSTTLVDTNGGRWVVEGRSKPITEDRNHNYGVLDIQGILRKSSNVGAAKVGVQLGPDLMLQYAKAFGLGKQDQPSEFFKERLGAIYVPKGGLTKGALATVSYGYQVTASPLQMASAMNVFATGGLLLRPMLVHATVDGDVRRVQEPRVISRVVSPQTAATMTTMLESVVEDGTGDKAALPQYRVAGKTGTASQVGKDGYSDTDYLVSFVGFAPSRNPRFTIAVYVEKPRFGPAYGGTVAAPVFRRVAEAALHHVGEQRSLNAAPAVVITERPQVTRPVRPLDKPAEVMNAGGVPTMPNLTGLTLRDAMRRLPVGMTVNPTGDGIVTSQSPAAGEPITNDRVVLKLQRQPATTGGSDR